MFCQFCLERGCLEINFVSPLDRKNDQAIGHTIPLDIAMLKMPLSKATVIDVSPVIGKITRTILNSCVNFGDLDQAVPLAGQDNLFVEFHTRDAFPPPQNMGWYGVHIVPFTVASKSVMFKNVPMPSQLVGWPQVYSVVVYRMAIDEMTTAPFTSATVPVSGQDNSTSLTTLVSAN